MYQWLMDIDQLAGCYQNSDVVIVDCRFSLADENEGASAYSKSHIPGAHYLHLNRDLSAVVEQHGGRHPLPDSERLKQRLESIGVSDKTLVVAYDDSRFAFASRLWWLLRYVGHSRIKILDGGFNAWSKAGLPVSDDSPTDVTPGKMTGRVNMSMVVDINQVKTIPHSKGCVLIDSRESERFLGIKEPIDPVAGHIAGAVNFPWTQVSDNEGMFRVKQSQQVRWAETLQAEEMVVYCGSGVTACVNLLSLAELGREDAKLYAGSWSDWCSYL